MSDKKNSANVSAVLIDWGGETFAVWCHKCCRIVECMKTEEPAIRCSLCTSKLAEYVGKDTAKALIEGCTLQ